MSVIRPARAKYCPQCHAMALIEAPGCAHCGHTFSTGLAPDALRENLSEHELHKTRMFTLPPVITRSDSAAERESISVIDPDAWSVPRTAGKRLRLIAASVALGLVFAVLAALWWFQLARL